MGVDINLFQAEKQKASNLKSRDKALKRSKIEEKILSMMQLICNFVII